MFITTDLNKKQKLNRFTSTWPRTSPLRGCPSVRRQCPSSKVIRVPKYQNWVTWPQPHPLRGCFMVLTHAVSILHLSTKFDADIYMRIYYSIHSKVIRVPKFKNWVTWPRQRPVMGPFMVHTSEGPSSMSVPNLKRIYSSQNYNIGPKI